MRRPSRSRMTVIRTISCLFAAMVSLAQTAPDANRLAKLPIRFEPNVGQAPAGVPFVARGTGYSLSLRAERAEFVFRSGETQARLEMQLVGARTGRPMTPSDKLPGVSNYLLSPARGGAKHGVPTYERVTAAGVYPGIDVTYYGSGQELEHDFVVSPHTDPAIIRMKYTGEAAPRVDTDGSLLLTTALGPIRQRPPVAYQQRDGKRIPVESRYSIHADGTIGFILGAYDTTATLTIDPALVYCTYLGGATPSGTDMERAYGVAVDATGAAYVAGVTDAADFPVANAMKPVKSAYQDIFIAKINPAGTALVYSTFIGGSESEEAHAVAVDGTGAVYLTGITCRPISQP